MKICIGNIFESRCDVLVNTVNCVGAMGKGIAFEFKKRYPDMFDDYLEKCSNGLIKPGLPYVYKGKDIMIINFPTKDHWKSPSRKSFIVDGLNWFVDNYKKLNIKSIAFPPLGCGNGGLKWQEIGPLMFQMLNPLPIDIEIYAPYGTSDKELTVEYLSRNVPTYDSYGITNYRINPKWYTILKVVQELSKRKYSINVGRTIYQKICYVLTREGVDTGFIFGKGSYGPYSSQVKESIVAFANANLIIEKNFGKMVALTVSDNFKFNENSFSKYELQSIAKTVDLFGRVKSTEHAEMIATILFSYDQLKKTKETIFDKDIYEYIMNWKPHWNPSRNSFVTNSIHDMAMLSWIDIQYSGSLPDTTNMY